MLTVTAVAVAALDSDMAVGQIAQNWTERLSEGECNHSVTVQFLFKGVSRSLGNLLPADVLRMFQEKEPDFKYSSHIVLICLEWQGVFWAY